MDEDERRYNPLYDPDDADMRLLPDAHADRVEDTFGDLEDRDTDAAFDNIDDPFEYRFYAGPALDSDGNYRRSTPGHDQIAVNRQRAGRPPAPPAGYYLPTLQRRIDHIALVVIPATSREDALDRTRIALERRPLGEAFPPAYDADKHGPTFELAHDYDPGALRTFHRQWGDLPDAVPLATDRGMTLFRIAREHTDWPEWTHPSDREPLDGSPRRETACEAASAHETERDQATRRQGTISMVDPADVYLYEADGTPIDTPDQLLPLLAEDQTANCPPSTASEGERPDTKRWLVPAILFRAVYVDQAGNGRSLGPTRERLECHQCDVVTIHEFTHTYTETPLDREPNHPAGKLTELFVKAETTHSHIWACETCDAARYGPDPEATST